jgi:hypothetical protein
MKVTVTAKEGEVLKEILEIISHIKGPRGGPTDHTKVLTNLIGKIEKAVSSSVKKPVELPLKDFMNMARFTLGERLKEQLNPGPAWYKQMQMRIDSRGLTRVTAQAALDNARDTWAGDIWVDTLINSLDKLAVMNPRNQKRTKLGWLNQLENEHNTQEA